MRIGKLVGQHTAARVEGDDAKRMQELDRHNPHFERVAEVPFSVVCFRSRPAGVSDEAMLETLNQSVLDAVNASMFFGEPFTLVIRDEFGPDEEKSLLAGPGVLYVRESAAAAATA